MSGPYGPDHFVSCFTGTEPCGPDEEGGDSAFKWIVAILTIGPCDETLRYRLADILFNNQDASDDEEDDKRAAKAEPAKKSRPPPSRNRANSEERPERPKRRRKTKE
jgi:hypothetical protein